MYTPLERRRILLTILAVALIIMISVYPQTLPTLFNNPAAKSARAMGW
jgi:hypothetical protein